MQMENVNAKDAESELHKSIFIHIKMVANVKFVNLA